MSSDPFARWRPKNQEITEESSKSSGDPLARWRPGAKQPEPEESLMHNVGRQTLRTAARATETVLGAPRAFGEFLEGLVPEKALIKGAEKIGLGEGAKTLIETTKKYAPYKALPTSQNVRQLNEFLFGKNVKPKNEWEQKADALVSDFSALALPIPGSQLKFVKPALLALGGNIASDVVGRLGGTDKQKTYAKLGTFLVGSLYNRKGAEKFRNELYGQARQSRPAEATVNAKNIESSIQKMRTDLHKGGSAPSKTHALKKIDELESAIKQGEIEVEELEKFKHSINELRGSLYEEFKGNKPGRLLAKRNLDNVSNVVDDGLREYGKTNPKWASFYFPANMAHGALAQSKRLSNYIDRNKGKITPHIAYALFGLGHTGGLIPTATTLGVGYGVVKLGELISRVTKGPLRKYYTGVLKNAAKEDAVAMRENLRKLEDGLQQEENRKKKKNQSSQKE